LVQKFLGSGFLTTSVTVYYIGYLELKLPGITSIYTESIEVKIDKVVLLASPVCDRKYDAEKDEALELARKRETLDKLEQLLLEQGMLISEAMFVFVAMVDLKKYLCQVPYFTTFMNILKL